MATSIPDARAALSAAKQRAIAQVSAIGATQFDVCVIGAGITGAQAVYNLLSLPAASAPRSILLIDSGTYPLCAFERCLTWTRM